MKNQIVHVYKICFIRKKKTKKYPILILKRVVSYQTPRSEGNFETIQVEHWIRLQNFGMLYTNTFMFE